MNREVKVSIYDICTGYVCAALVMYILGGVAYYVGKRNGKIEICEKIDDLIEKHSV